MIATMGSYFISAYQACRCSWTMCQCWNSYQADQPFWITTVSVFKPETNKTKMDRLRFRIEARPEQHRHYRAPVIRPSIQALSMRIK